MIGSGFQHFSLVQYNHQVHLYHQLGDEAHQYIDNKFGESSDIGPITISPGAFYKSRPLSGMIKSAMSTRSLKSQSISSESGN